MKDYLSDFDNSIKEYERKQKDIEKINNEILEYSKSLEKFSTIKLGNPINIHIKKVEDPTLSKVDILALKASYGVRGYFRSFKKPYLCLNNTQTELNEPFAFFEMSEEGFPIIAKLINDEYRLNSLEEIQEFFRTMTASYKFIDELKDFSDKINLKTLEMEEEHQLEIDS